MTDEEPTISISKLIGSANREKMSRKLGELEVQMPGFRQLIGGFQKKVASSTSDSLPKSNIQLQIDKFNEIDNNNNNNSNKTRRMSLVHTSSKNDMVRLLNLENKRLRAELDDYKNSTITKKEHDRRIVQIADRCKKELQELKSEFNEKLIEKDRIIREQHNELVDLKGQIRVAVRIRDSLSKIVCCKSEVRLDPNGQPYQFEHVFAPTLKQLDVFKEIKELIQSVLHGYNVCLVAYGPTGSGKTFTMFGESDNEGVVPRSIRFLLEQSSKDLADIGWQFRFSASYVEVYNEEVFDLLDDRKKLKIAIGSAPSVKKLPIRCLEDVDVILAHAGDHRSTAATGCNELSSRSHALFDVHVESINSTTGENAKCTLTLVDLAGSERVRDCGATGERFVELTNINQSLTTLKKCIRAQMMRSSHVPFRESKLTALLRLFLGNGSAKTMFIAHLNPSDVAETKRTLEFTAELRSTSVGRAQVQRKEV
ncbi:unnamed protein product [Caenorhabditis bovis]|uniref:Kinesin motor domain-containing protein n=1 Tax=Caenorhabditis bovis TaxID=2654633 RepID=A0A8S1EW77_9PELO|nr:unnamed protein product [Caenorhabditis bovis]